MLPEDEGVSLFAYQQEGAKWLAERRLALLADEMGLGKSAQAIVAANICNATSILVLCPAVARLNWIREFSKFSSRRWTSLPLITAADARRIASADCVICSYDLTTRSGVMSALRQRSWDVCVADEAHYLKNRSASRTKAVLGKDGIRFERLWALTGTPAPNHAGELWPLLVAFGVVREDYWTFLRRYCVLRETPFGTQVVGGRRLDELRQRMAPVIMRRKKADVATQLPKISYQDVVVEPTPISDEDALIYFEGYLTWPRDRRAEVFHRDLAEQQRILDTMVGTFGVQNAGGTPAGVLSVLEGLQNKVGHLRRYIGLQKAPKVVETIRAELEAKAYDKIVIFGIHKAVLETLHTKLKDFGAVLIYGGTPAAKRDKLVERFQNESKCRVFIGQVVAAGTAITLTAAHHVAFVEADWTPANNQQAAMRVHRIGQTKPVTVRFFGMSGSIDERIQKVLKRKTRDLTELFDEPLPDIFA